MKVVELNKKLLEKTRSKGVGAEIDLAYDIAEMVIDARLKKDMSQKKLAKLIGTKQPAIARIESGSQLPSNLSLQKIANALGTKLIPPKFEMMTDQNEINYIYGETTVNELNAFNLGLELASFDFSNTKNKTEITNNFSSTRTGSK